MGQSLLGNIDALHKYVLGFCEMKHFNSLKYTEKSANSTKWDIEKV